MTQQVGCQGQQPIYRRYSLESEQSTIEHITYSSTFELGSRHKHRISKMSWYEVSFQNSIPTILFFGCYCSYCSCLMLSLSCKKRLYNHFLVLISRLLRCLREGWGVCASAMLTEDNCAKVKLRKHKTRNTYRTYSAVPTTIPFPLKYLVNDHLDSLNRSCVGFFELGYQVRL